MHQGVAQIVLAAAICHLLLLLWAKGSSNFVSSQDYS